MDKRIEEYWVEKYPNLFPGYHMSPRETPMGRGFTCANGWFHILDKLWKELSKIDGLTIGQVKEKLAGLRVYPNPGKYDIDKVRALIRTAMLDSSEICEMCGKPGSRRGGDWLFTLCDECVGEDKWAISEETGNRIVRELGLRTICKTKEDHLHDFGFNKCIVCGAKYNRKTGEWSLEP